MLVIVYNTHLGAGVNIVLRINFNMGLDRLEEYSPLVFYS